MKATLIILAILITPRLALACSCGSRPSVCASFYMAEAVFVGTVSRVENKSAKSENGEEYTGGQTAYVQVEESFKGAKVSEMIFRSYGSSCDPVFREGERRLFYAYFNKDEKVWEIHACDRSTLIEWASDDLLYLRNLPVSAQKTRLAGVLRNHSNKPMMGIKVKVSDGRQVYEAFTDKNGVYEFLGLPSGKYSIQPEVPVSLKIRYSIPTGELDSTSREARRFVLTEKSCAGENFYFTENTSVSGKVFDPDGLPLKDVCVRLMKKTPPDTLEDLSSCTKEDGRFKIDEIPLGDYVLVAANEPGKITSSTPFPPLYYPGVFDREKATVLTLASGDQRQDMDIRVPSMQLRHTIEGRLLYSDGRPVADETVEFSDETEDGEQADATTDANGHFSLAVLDGLKGSLRGYILTYPGEYKDCPAIEKLVDKSQDQSLVELTTNVIKLEMNTDSRDVELKFPFPYCAKKARARP